MLNVSSSFVVSLRLKSVTERSQETPGRKDFLNTSTFLFLSIISDVRVLLTFPRDSVIPRLITDTLQLLKIPSVFSRH